MLAADATMENGPEKLDRSAQSFFGAMAGFIVLDLVVLCWLLNPFSGLAPESHSYRLVDKPAIGAFTETASAASMKPSPLGVAPDGAPAKVAPVSRVVAAPAFVEVQK